MMIKAIETTYKGYRFRSRLEARWAVFFDALGIEYQYEVEGFEFEGQRYLPDFWLPTAKMWIEIKPKGERLSIEYMRKLGSFAEEIKQPLMVLQGEPYRDEFDIMAFPPSVVRWFNGVTSFAFFVFYIFDKTSDKAGELWIVLMKENGELVGDISLGKILGLMDTGDNVLDQAYLAARQARFGKDSRG